MMHGAKKSDPAIVAVKAANEAGYPVEEWLEPRAGAEGNVREPRTVRAQNRVAVSPGLARIRRFAVNHPRWEPYAGIPHVRFCAGGAR